MKAFTIALILFLSFSTISISQFFKPPKDLIEKAPNWAQLMYSDNPNVFEVEEEFRRYYKNKTVKKDVHTRNLKFWRRSIKYRIQQDGYLASPSEQKYQARNKKNKNATAQKNMAGGWTLLGPLQSLSEDGDPSADQACVYSIDQSLTNPDILVCGTEPGEVYKSTDAGESWTNMSLELVLPFDQSAVRAVAIHPTDPNKIYFTVQDMIYRSIDGGTIWNILHTIDSPNGEEVIVEKMFIHPNQPNIMMIASRESLLRSTDEGTSWTTVFEDPTFDIEMNTASDNIIYALRKNADTELPEFLISTDFGVSFTLQNNGWYSSSDAGRESDGGRIAVTQADPNKVYAYLIGQSKPGDFGYIGVYRSDDGGNYWTLPNGPNGGPYTNSHPNLASGDGLGDPFYADISFCALAVSNDDANKILIGGLNLWKSDDGGETFQPLGGYVDGPLNDDVGNFHVDMQEFKVFGNTSWIVSDGGIYKSSDFFSPNNFEKKNNGVHSTDFWGFGSGWNQDVLIGGVFHNGVMAYNETYGEGNYISLGGGEPSSGYVNPGENNLVYSTDIGGVIIPDAIGPVSDFGYDFIPNESFDPLLEGYSDIVFHPQCYSVAFTGKLHELWRTVDKGLSFQKIKTFGTIENDFLTFIHISRANPDIIYVCQRLEATDQAKLWKSIDAGQTWEETTLPSDVFKFIILQVDPYDPSNIWIASARMMILLSYTNQKIAVQLGRIFQVRPFQMNMQKRLIIFQEPMEVFT